MPNRSLSPEMVTFGQAIREGHFNRLTDCVARLKGHPPRSLRSVLLQFRDRWPEA